MRFYSTDGPSPDGGSSGPSEEILSELQERVRRKLPAWTQRGPEDPGWVLLEAFAEALSELRADLEEIEARAYPRIFESLGEEARWAVPAKGAVVFVAEEGLSGPVIVPKGTAITQPRKTGEPLLTFETVDDAWLTRSKLLRVVSCAGNQQTDVFPHPQSGWDGEPVGLFGERAQILRHLYLGDPALLLLRDASGGLSLEWPGHPGALLEGTWEYRVEGGWRMLGVEFEAVRSAAGKRVIRMRIPGPLPDLVEEPIEGASLPWIRLSLPGERRVVLPTPAWARSELDAGAKARRLPSPASGGGRSLPFPRPVFRVLSQGGERWEDHSLSPEKIIPPESPEAWNPAVYLGWEEPAPASVYWSFVKRSTAGDRTQPSPPRLVWEHSSARGFKAFELWDGTQSFTQSGIVSWRLPSEWAPQEHFGERLFWVRARWVSGEYLSPPLVSAVLPHAAEICQRRTLKNHLLEVTLDRSGRGALELAFPEGEPERFSLIEIRSEGKDWERLLDLSLKAAPVEPHLDQAHQSSPAPERRTKGFRVWRSPRGDYILDVGGAWEGQAKIRIPLLRVGLGSRGNVPPGALTIVEAEIPGLKRVLQPLRADGGLDPEGPEAFRLRLEAEWKTGNRAVTAQDFTRLCRALDPEIARVEVSPDLQGPGRILVTLVPEEPFHPERFSHGKLAWLQENLSRKVPLGTSIEVVEPVYLHVEVRARSATDASPPPESTRRILEERLRRFFHPLTGGPDGQGFPLKKEWKGEELCAVLSDILEEESSSDQGGSVPREWDPKAWRLEVCRPGGEALEDVVHSSQGPFPLVLPRLDRLVFSPRDSRGELFTVDERS